MSWAEQQEAVGDHFPHRWEEGAWGPCIRRDPTGHDITGKYAQCRCGAQCYVGKRLSTGETVAFLWPAGHHSSDEGIDVPAEALR